MSDVEVQDWREEAKSVINDIKEHVTDVHICEAFQNNDHKIYLNLTTLESKPHCIELSASGFRVVGNDFNEMDLNEETYFETPYSLLSSISPQYRSSFGNALLTKLNALHDSQK